MHGPLVHISPNVTLLSDPADIETVLGYSGDFSITADFVGRPIASDHDPAWTAGRKAVYAALRVLTDGWLVSLARDAFDEMMDAWPAGPVTDGLARMERATGSIIGRLCLGNDTNRATEHTREMLALLFEMAGQSLGEYRPALVRQVNACERQLYREILASVQKRLTQRCTDNLAGLLTHPEVGSIDPPLAARLVMSVLLAGSGVPASVLAWTVVLLDRSPAAKELVANEVAGVSRECFVREKIPFTEAVIKEAMRLYPPTWLLERKLRRERIVGGVRFLTGHLFYMSSFITGRDPRFFEHPTAFFPARWLDVSFTSSLPRHAYFPFGAGPAACLGQFVAMRELCILTALLVAEGNLAVVDPSKLRLGAKRGLRPLHLTLLRG
jgi:unspecific monooxygenase